MVDFDCSFDAYQKLMSSGVVDKIRDKGRDISFLFTSSNLYSVDGGDLILDRAKEVYENRDRAISDLSASAKDVLTLEKKFDESPYNFDNEDLFFEHPSFLGWFVLGEDFDYKSKGFSSLRSMYESIVSYCLGNRWNLSNFNDDYSWRNSSMNNLISLNVHGDFYVNQNDISSKLERNLFGEDFVSAKINPKKGGIASYQDSSYFLYSVLKYADFLGMNDIREIKDWRNVLDEVGSVGTATTECLSGGGSLGFNFFDCEILKEGVAPSSVPITIYGSGNSSFVPIVGRDDNLYFTDYDNYRNPISLDDWRLRFFPSDVPDLLKGTYRLFTRDKSLLPKIMDGFLKL